MKRLLLIFFVLALAASCHRGPQVIPRDEMEEIMYEVLMQDQYIKINPPLRRTADTTLVYEGIFEKHGYDTDDFRASLFYYLSDPSRMEKMMEKVEAKLMEKAKEAEIEVQKENWRKSFLRIYNLPFNRGRLPQPKPSAVDTLYTQFNKDSLAYHPHPKKK